MTLAAPPTVSTATSLAQLNASAVWALRLAGLAALVNGAGFGAFDIPATWHLTHDHEVWMALGNPTYGHGPFEAHGITVTVPVLLAFFGSCLVQAIGGALLLVPRTTGVVVTLAGILGCAPFWWGFDLPFAWFSAVTILALLAMAWAAWMHPSPRPASRREPDAHEITNPSPPAATKVGGGIDDSRALQRAGWAGAASVALLVLGLALTYLVGVDQASMSDAAILERLNDGGRQAAAGIGVPVLATGVALLLWFATGLRQLLDRLCGGDPLAHATVPAAALLGGLLITAVSLDVSSAFAALSDEFTPDPDTVRALGMAGQVLGLTGLIGGAVLVAVTTRIAQQAHALPPRALWVSYVVAVLCLSGFWSAGMASVAFALWLIGAVIGVLRAARRTPPARAAPAQGTPAPEVASTPPTTTSG